MSYQPLYDRDFFDGNYVPQLAQPSHYDFYAQPLPQIPPHPDVVHSDVLLPNVWRPEWNRQSWQPAVEPQPYQPTTYVESKPRIYQIESPSAKPFRCQICGKCFSQAANLTAHKRVHTGEKPFECSVCNRPFSQSSSLVTHRRFVSTMGWADYGSLIHQKAIICAEAGRTHTGERPYPCKHCDKAFTDSSTLTKHLRTHTGQKPYGCPLCQMRFTQSGNLHRHMKTHKN